MGIYRGVVRVNNGQTTLDANGVVVGIDGDLTAFRKMDGLFTAVQGQQEGATIRGASPAASAELATGAEDDSPNMEPVIAAIKNRKAELMKPGVLRLRPGFSEKNPHTIEPVIVVITDPAKQVEKIPPAIDGIKIEVRPADIFEQVGDIIPFSVWENADAQEAEPNINYVPPDSVSLTEMDVSNITCHVGPDSGWSTLKPFLEGTNKSLTIAMYEFYAQHVIDTVTTLGEESEATLEIILQVDKNDKDCEATLENSWGDRLTFVPAAVKGPNRIFNNSYHTKVVVRDSKAVWVSSGNFSPNSQPEIQPGTENTLYKNGNREWHVIIKDKQIAEMYEKFIRYDMKMAAEVRDMESAPSMPDLLVPESFFIPEAVVLQEEPFEAETFAQGDEMVKIMPLMSPDNYAEEVLKLIRSAKKSLYLQFSYINQPSTKTFDKIISAISEKMKLGLDVKVIAGSNQKPESSDLLIGKRKWKRKMFRIQKTKLHNKGIIVDGKIAVVGSNNWSNDGTQYNRDTSIVFFSREIAKYYTRVFDFDWNNLTREVNTGAEMSPELAPESGPTPVGKVRIPWQAYFNE